MEKLQHFFLPKLKFAATSAVATFADYSIYLAMFYLVELEPVPSNVISYSIAVAINFTLQKRFIFELKRNWKHAFAISMGFSIIGLLLSTLFIYLLSEYPFFDEHQFLTKAIVTGVIFLYNFYSKKFSFEKTVR